MGDLVHPFDNSMLWTVGRLIPGMVLCINYPLQRLCSAICPGWLAALTCFLALMESTRKPMPTKQAFAAAISVNVHCTRDNLTVSKIKRGKASSQRRRCNPHVRIRKRANSIS